ncbi:Uncharacterised protein [Streptococcus infantis]|nr:Uncharacterised protein [Streptococcus infantis]
MSINLPYFLVKIQMNRSDKKNVSLNNVKAPISWTTILLFILGMIITIYSLLYKNYINLNNKIM